MDKRGLSDVVITVLIILISILAVIMVWQVVRNIVAGVDMDTSKLTLDLKISRADIYRDMVNVTVNRNIGEGNLTGIALKFQGEGKDYVAYFNSTINELELKLFNVSLYNKIDVLEKVSVAPIITTAKGKRVVGNILDTYYIKGGIYPYGTPSP